MALVCVTNDVPDLRPCTIVGEHAANCTGYGTRWDRDEERRVPTDAECKGCLPAQSEVGLLCFSCWEKVQDGLKHAVDIITHLRSIDRAAQMDNAGVRGSSGWVIPVPNTWRTADDLLVLLGHPTPGFPSDAGVWEVEAITERYVDAILLELWVARESTAKQAARFIATMHAALIQHPMEDYEHRVRNVRCPDCRQRSLLWKPPLMFEGEVRVACQNPLCSFVATQDEYAEVAASELAQVKERMSLAKTAAAVGRRMQAKAVRDAARLAAKQAIAELPPDTPIPVSGAHDVIGVSKATIYRWVERGLLEVDDSNGVRTVTPKQVREADVKVARGRHPKVAETLDSSPG